MVAPQPAALAGTSLSAHLRFWLLALAVIVADLGSKKWVFDSLQPDEIRAVLPGAVDFRRSLNAGAVFGSFAGRTVVFIVASVLAMAFVFWWFVRSERRQRLLHFALSIILAGALGNLYDRAFVLADVVETVGPSRRCETMIGIVVSKPGDPLVRVGHWPDGSQPRAFNRLEVVVRRQGVVRDFIKFVPRFPEWFPRLGGYDVWPWVFNVADASLVCGVGLLLIFGRTDRKTLDFST